MKTQESKYIRLCLACLPLAGLLFAIGIVLRGPSLDPAADPARWAESATAANAPAAWLVIFAGMVLVLPGFWGLYAYLAGERPSGAAFWGMLFSILGVALVVPVIGFMALAAPVVATLYRQGQEEVIAVAVSMAAGGPGLVIASLSGLAYTAGSILSAVALWRHGAMPRPLVVSYALQAPLLAIVALFSVTAEFVGAIFLLASGGWLAWNAWRTVRVIRKLEVDIVEFR